MSRGCRNSPDIFCYVCGQFTPSDSQSNITPLLKRCYLAYFGCKLGDQDKPFAPHKACKSCISKLQMWSVGKLKCMPFGVPMVWREQMNHHDDCYFCMTKVAGFNKKTKDHIIYPDIPSAIRPVSHSDDIPVPVPPDTWEISSEADTSDTNEMEVDYEPPTNDDPKLFTQVELNDLVRDLNLPKESAQLLGSRLKEHRLLAPGTTF
ncbi:uncharacterized protein LOC121873827 [Homarus americanus]|uniref:uncharacterized protein LOC121873827 n=1 Tax=Homarus americanus TaxID=6706 RepID=UPI001C481F69|nr:uncharacterized protein LOC121873827 [Homarus americanus]XP_042233504.1 uncharacterized protein LOC121873827 [Homarus americanus]